MEIDALLAQADAARRAGQAEVARAALARVSERHPHDPRAAVAAFLLSIEATAWWPIVRLRDARRAALLGLGA